MLGEIEAGRAILGIGGVGLGVAAARDLRHRAEFAVGGILSWAVIGVSRARPMRSLLAWERYRVVLVLQCVAGLAAPVAAVTTRAGAAALACALAVAALLTLQRSGYGTDGSDQMFALVMVAAAVTLTLGGSYGRLFLAFLAAQLLLSYVVSGVAKLASSTWRDGSCLAQILTTESYGSPRVAALLKARPVLALALAWGVMVLESAFWMVVFVPRGLMWCLLAAAAALHFGIACVMGLRTFLFAFVGAYPALVFTVMSVMG
ncbi:hypothetical protein ACWGCW_07550 [Streptomyces sp. NPDC054933]